MNNLQTTLMILGIIALVLAIFALFYTIAAQRRKAIMLKKADYLVEDLTFKSELLNPTVESLAKFGNYMDVFEVAARQNVKVAAKVISNNKDDIYKVLNKFKRSLVGKDSKPTTKKASQSKTQKVATKKGGK